jgi:hypothetical protein
MLLTNVIRSASSEALPNHRSFPAKYGLTSRLPFRNRCLWEQADEPTATSFGKANAFEERQKRVCCGSIALAIVIDRRSWESVLQCPPKSRGGGRRQCRLRMRSFHRTSASPSTPSKNSTPSGNISIAPAKNFSRNSTLGQTKNRRANDEILDAVSVGL